MNENNKYGYIVYYKEKRNFIRHRHLVTNSYPLAVWEIENYKKYPQYNRKTNRLIREPTWYIKPITTKIQSIIAWWGCPF